MILPHMLWDAENHDKIVRLNRIQLLDCLLRYDADIDQAYYGTTALSQAIMLRDHLVATWLLEHGANPDSMNGRGQTPVHFAAQDGWLTGLELMKPKGASLDVRDNFMRTPLVMAAGNGHSRCVQFFIQN